MKPFFIVILLTFFVIYTFAKRFAIIGETGAGKSTFISSIFGVDAPTGKYASCTNITQKYPASAKAAPGFKNSTAYDTPGTYDTTGKTNAQIMNEIETFYLKQMNVSEASNLDAFIVIIGGTDERVRFLDLMKTFISSFSTSVLKSMVIVINQHEHQSTHELQDRKRFVERQAVGVMSTAFENEIIDIPFVILNANNPSQEQINALTSALSKVPKYPLVHLDEKRKEIEKIFETMIADSKNYKEEIEKILKEEEINLQEEVFQKVPKTFTNTKVEGCKISGGIPGFIKICIPNKVDEKITLVIDEKVTINKKEKRPVIEDKINRMLKNEKQIYWDRAVEEYEKKLREKFVIKQANHDL